MVEEARRELAETVKWIHSKGWAPGTGGNFGVVCNREPIRLLITPSGIDKGSVLPEDLLLVDEQANVVEGHGKPSAETLLHIAIVRQRSASAILHTHSIWNTLASLAASDVYSLTGYEMLKGLAGVQAGTLNIPTESPKFEAHFHNELVPVLENSQDIAALGALLAETLARYPNTHAVLLRGHGMYTWGADLAEARRHAEVLEFLFELDLRAKRIQ